MTFAERVEALAPLRVTDRQAAFVATVALHSGYCLRRQYTAFAGVRQGKSVRDFLDGLVDRQIARRFSYRADRGYIYHLYGRSLYRALQQDDNRNRRYASPALVARKLMLLDLVLQEPNHEWFATEQEKVELFTTRLRLPADALPQRTYHSSMRTDGNNQSTTRNFVQKLPVFLTDDPQRVHFVCVVTDPAASEIATFLREHAGLLPHLPTWTLVVTGPSHVLDQRRCFAAFNRAVHGVTAQLPSDPADLRWYVETRRLVEEGSWRSLSVADLKRFREYRARWGHRLDMGGREPLHSSFTPATDAPVSSQHLSPSGQLLIRPLPFTYQQLGSTPGLC